MTRVIAIKGYRLSKGGKLQRVTKVRSVSQRLKEKDSKRVRVVRKVTA